MRLLAPPPPCRVCRSLWRVPSAVLLAALLSNAGGCGVGEYRERVRARVVDLGTASEFAGLYSPQAMGDKPVSVRVPQAFQRPPLVAGVAIAEEGAAPDDVRVRPGWVELPGLTYTYEEFVADAEGGQIPYYLYLSAENKNQPGFRDPTTRWLSQLRDRAPDQGFAWEDVACDTPEGRSVIWRRVRAVGEQPFYYVDKDGQSRVVKMPGILEVYYRLEGDWSVALAWRVPEAIAGHVGLGKWAPMVAGSVQVRGQADGSGTP